MQDKNTKLIIKKNKMDNKMIINLLPILQI